MCVCVCVLQVNVVVAVILEKMVVDEEDDDERKQEAGASDTQPSTSSKAGAGGGELMPLVQELQQQVSEMQASLHHITEMMRAQQAHSEPPVLLKQVTAVPAAVDPMAVTATPIRSSSVSSAESACSA